MSGKREAYNKVLTKLFVTVLGSVYFKTKNPTPQMYNRVRRMCKLYTPECVDKGVIKLSEAIENGTFVPPLNPINTLNYLNGIVRSVFDKDQTLEINRNPPSLGIIKDIGKDL